MDSPYLFISYSRIQFYFVESLAYQLRATKVPYWFDVEQLEMGKDWQSGIDNGLANCQALVLVVSNASIGSPNVKYEWDAAQKANKPIYLALFEAVDLPPELRDVPIIDFRGNFKRGVERLAKLFQAGQTGQSKSAIRTDRAPRPGRLQLPSRMESQVHIVYLTLLLVAVGSVFGAALLAPLSLSLAFIVLLMAAGYGYYWWRFAKRQYIHSEIWNGLAFSVLFSFGAFLGSFVAGSSKNALVVNEAPFLMLLYGLMFIGSLLSLTAMSSSAAIFRWSPLGQGAQLRDRALHIQRKRSVKFTPLHKTFSLSYAPPDSRVGAQVRRAMTKAHYSEVPVDQATADHNLVVLSNSTPAALFEAHSGQLKKPVSIVASSIRGATQSENELRAVTRFQWVDYRTRQPKALLDMAEILWLGDNGQPVSEADYYVVPEGFRLPVVPTSTFFLVSLMRFAVAFYGSYALFGILGMLLPGIQSLRLAAATSTSELMIDVVEIVLGVFLLWLCVGIMQRSVNFSVSLVGMVAVILLVVVFPALPLLNALNTLKNVTAATSAGQSGVDIQTHNQTIYFLLNVGVGLIFVIAYLLNLRSLYRWLPLTNEPIRTAHKAEPTLRQPFGQALWRTNVLFVVVFAGGVLALNQAGANLTANESATQVSVTIDHLQLTMPQGVASMFVANSDLRTIIPPTWVSPTFADFMDQFVHRQPAYGPLLWLGAYHSDPAAPDVIALTIWRFQPQPSFFSFLVPEHPEAEIDRIFKVGLSDPTLSNFSRTTGNNQGTMTDTVTFDEPGLTNWRIAIRGKQYSYLLFIFGSKQDLAQNQATLTKIVSSAVVN